MALKRVINSCSTRMSEKGEALPWAGEVLGAEGGEGNWSGREKRGQPSIGIDH
jgi:hypothetical protein